MRSPPSLAGGIAALVLVLVAGGVVRAQDGRGRDLAASMTGLRWGMTKEQVLRVFEREIEGEFRTSLANVRGLVEEDRLLQTIERKKRRLRDGWVAFRGQRTGWDVSFLGLEYTHGNHEAMLRIQEPGAEAQEFYFFIRGHLWKWYRAFRRETFGGRNFDEVGLALEQRYGPAVHRFEPDPDTDDLITWLEWEDEDTRLRLIDESRFFGFYCLVFESKATLARLESLRRNTIRRGRRRSTRRLVDAVTPERSPDEELGRNADIVDRLTGTNHRPLFTGAPETDDDPPEGDAPTGRDRRD